MIDRFFTTHVIGPIRLAAFRSQHRELEQELADTGNEQRERIQQQLVDIDTRIERQIGHRGRRRARSRPRAYRREDGAHGHRSGPRRAHADLHEWQSELDLSEGCEILDSLPNLTAELAKADDELRRRVYDAFRSPSSSTAIRARYD